MKRNVTVGFVLLVAALLFGCAAPVVNFSQLAAQYPKMMIGNKSDIPVYVVVDPSTVPASGQTPTQWPIKWEGLDHFVGRDIVGALSLFFNSVKAGPPNPGLADQKVIIVEVRVDTLTYHTEKASSGGTTAQTNYAEMDWALGLRPSNASEYIFSYAGKAKGTVYFATRNAVPDAYRDLISVAISQFLKAYTDEDVHQKVLQL